MGCDWYIYMWVIVYKWSADVQLFLTLPITWYNITVGLDSFEFFNASLLTIQYGKFS